jgi:hypothetical protein
MRTPVLFLVLILFQLPLHAQEVWNDYVIGRPMAGYYDAKKTIAKEWGINYQATFAGCVLSDEISDKAKAYQDSNKAYFETLVAKYGQNWMQDFELEVKKEVYRNDTQEKGTWYEIADNNKNKAFYTKKKAVAKTWGIAYEAKFLSEDMNAAQKSALTELFLANNDYVSQLKNTFGQNWQETLNQEVNFELAKQEVPNPKHVWIDYVMGKPYMPYFEAKKVLAKEWGINYEFQFQGCSLSKKMQQEATKVQAANAPYFKALEKQFGKDWKVRFDIAVQKKVDQERSSQQ